MHHQSCIFATGIVVRKSAAVSQLEKALQLSAAYLFQRRFGCRFATVLRDLLSLGAVAAINFF
jgi:hypothetical protein